MNYYDENPEIEQEYGDEEDPAMDYWNDVARQVAELEREDEEEDEEMTDEDENPVVD